MLRIIFTPYNEEVKASNSRNWRGDHMEKEFITVRSLAKLLSISEQTTYRLARENKIPGIINIGKSIRFNKIALVEWLQNGGTKNDN